MREKPDNVGEAFSERFYDAWSAGAAIRRKFKTKGQTVDRWLQEALLTGEIVMLSVADGGYAHHYAEWWPESSDDWRALTVTFWLDVGGYPHLHTGGNNLTTRGGAFFARRDFFEQVIADFEEQERVEKDERVAERRSEREQAEAMLPEAIPTLKAFLAQNGIREREIHFSVVGICDEPKRPYLSLTFMGEDVAKLTAALQEALREGVPA